MRPPNIPLELDILLSLDDLLAVILNNRFDIHQTVIVQTLIKTLFEFIVITLGVEGQDGMFAIFAFLGFM